MQKKYIGGLKLLENLRHVIFVKIKTFCEITDGLLMDNYQANVGLQNVKVVLKTDIKLLCGENKLFCHVFEDFRVDPEILFSKIDQSFRQT